MDRKTAVAKKRKERKEDRKKERKKERRALAGKAVELEGPL
jgi:hypothetical protein